MSNSFKKDLLNGLHAFGDEYRPKDTFKAALYYNDATITPETATYIPDGEVVGNNYIAGGVQIEINNPPVINNGIAHITPSTSISFPLITIDSPFDALLIYNDSTPDKRTVSVHTFGNQIVTSGTFNLVMPEDTDVTGLLRLV
jgi:hypothetical protein